MKKLLSILLFLAMTLGAVAQDIVISNGEANVNAPARMTLPVIGSGDGWPDNQMGITNPLSTDYIIMYDDAGGPGIGGQNGGLPPGGAWIYIDAQGNWNFSGGTITNAFFAGTLPATVAVVGIEVDPIFSAWLITNGYIQIESDPAYNSNLADHVLFQADRLNTGGVLTVWADTSVPHPPLTTSNAWGYSGLYVDSAGPGWWGWNIDVGADRWFNVNDQGHFQWNGASHTDAAYYGSFYGTFNGLGAQETDPVWVAAQAAGFVVDGPVIVDSGGLGIGWPEMMVSNVLGGEIRMAFDAEGAWLYGQYTNQSWYWVYRPDGVWDFGNVVITNVQLPEITVAGSTEWSHYAAESNVNLAGNWIDGGVSTDEVRLVYSGNPSDPNAGPFLVFYGTNHPTTTTRGTVVLQSGPGGPGAAGNADIIAADRAGIWAGLGGGTYGLYVESNGVITVAAPMMDFWTGYGITNVGDIIPYQSNVFSLGNAAFWWQSAYVKTAYVDSATVLLGTNPLSYAGGKLTINDEEVVTTDTIAQVETDPIFTNWLATSPPPTGTPLYVETDPVWTSEKGGYATGTPVYAEGDPIWLSEKSSYATGVPVYAESDPVWLSEKSGYATGTPLYVYTETDPIFTNWLVVTPPATGDPLYVETDAVFTNWRATNFNDGVVKIVSMTNGSDPVFYLAAGVAQQVVYTGGVIVDAGSVYPYNETNKNQFAIYEAGTNNVFRENQVNGQLQFWRMDFWYSNKSAAANIGIDWSIENPVSGFQRNMPITLPSGVTEGRCTFPVMYTYADPASMEPPEGTGLGGYHFYLEISSGTLDVQINDITRYSPQRNFP